MLAEALPVLGCAPVFLSPGEAADLVEEIAVGRPGLHSVVVVPDTYWPEADWLLAFTTDVRRFAYDLAIVLRGGEIVAISKTSCANGGIERVYPPNYLVHPPPLIGPLPAGRLSGIAVVDDVLHALYSGDLEPLAELVRYTERACENGSSADLHAFLPCLPGEAPGTPGVSVAISRCHSDDLRPEQFREELQRLLDTSPGLYAVSPTDGSFFASTDDLWPGQRYVLTLAATSTHGMALILSDSAIVGLFGSCSTQHPTDFNIAPPADPEFLLPPP